CIHSPASEAQLAVATDIAPDPECSVAGRRRKSSVAGNVNAVRFRRQSGQSQTGARDTGIEQRADDDSRGRQSVAWLRARHANRPHTRRG
ncbi:conserved hypothetical protein, partial [Ricinus communis]